MVYCFEVIIPSRGFHVYKETTWSNAKVGDEVKVEVDFSGWKTVSHIPREISQYVFFFIKQEDGRFYGKLKSLKYKRSLIPLGGLEVSLLLKFESQVKWVTDTMEDFVELSISQGI